MKKILLCAAVAAALPNVGSSYDITFTNIEEANATAVPIIDNAGNPIALGSGFVSAGTFTSAPTGIASLSNFVPFGTGNTAFSNGISAPGFFDGIRSAPIPQGTTTPPVGEAIFIVVGNNADLSASNQFAIIDAGAVVGTENQSGQGAVAFIGTDSVIDSNNLIFGTLQTNVDIPGLLVFNEAIQLAAIPEPSSSFLIGLAGLMLAGRRRR